MLLIFISSFNSKSKKEYRYTTADTIGTTLNKTTTYTYGNTNWKDQLTSYNGKAITYDGIGNPLTYDGNTYSWQNGRQLSGITNTGKSQTITYKYNNSGIRTEKTVNGVKTNYYLDGSKVIYEKTGSNIIYYIYDENGMITALRYNDINYYYIKNAQNDIVGLLDTNLNQVVSYEYDSWGNILSIKDASGNQITSNTHIGIINPYRYRSYRYDTETNLYYLQSRYYSSEWGRFLNFDNYGGEVGSLISHNGYAYGNNNPVNNVDMNGNFAISIGAILGIIIIAIVITTIPKETWTDIGTTIGTAVENVADGIQSTWKSITTKKNTTTATKTEVTTKTITKDKNKKQDNYWQAQLVGGNVIIGKSISYEEALIRVQLNQNIMCKNIVYATSIVKNFPNSIGPEIDKNQIPGRIYYQHFHINDKHGIPHIWFYGD